MDASRISACTYPLIKKPLAEALAAIRKAGFTKADPLGRMPHFSLVEKECDAGQVMRQSREAGVALANLGTYLGPGFLHADEEKREAELKNCFRAIDLAVQFGARTIRILRVSKDMDKAENLAAFLPWVKRAAAYAERKNVLMGIENHGGGLSGQIDKTLELFEKTGSRHFGLLYDPCNYFTYGGDYKKGLEAHREHIVHVHIKDAAIQAGKPQLTMLGEGQIDFRWVIDQLENIGYQGDFAMEYELESVAPEVGLPRWFETFSKL